MKCSQCEYWKDRSKNDYGTCTNKKSKLYGVRTMSMHTCKCETEIPTNDADAKAVEEKRAENLKMEKLRTEIMKKMSELEDNIGNRHMNDSEYSKYTTFTEVLDMIDEITEIY